MTDPFERFRARSLLGWVAGWLVVVIVLNALSFKIPHVGFTLYLAVIGWIWYQYVHNHIDIRDFIRRAPGRDDWRRLWLVIPALVLSFGFGALLLLWRASPEMMRRLAELDTRGDTPGATIFLTVMLVVVGPAAEEVMFRGLLLHRWARKWGLKRAAFLSSAIFAVLHLNPIGAFVFAMLMVHLYTRSGSLRVPMAAHMLNNAIVSGLGALGSRSPKSPADALAELRAAWPGIALMSAISALVLIAYFRRVPPISSWTLPVIGGGSSPEPTPAR